MFIIKKKAEVIRFGLFLVMMGVLAYFVASRFEAWRVSRQETVRQEAPAVSPLLAGPQGQNLIDRARVEPDGVNFFADFRMERERSRSALRETLKEVMDNPATAAVTRQQASDQYLAAGKYASLEDRAEQLVKAKGFDDVVVNIAEQTAQVVVKAKSLSQQQFMQVVDMVSRVTGVKTSAIQVIARER